MSVKNYKKKLLIPAESNILTMHRFELIENKTKKNKQKELTML